MAKQYIGLPDSALEYGQSVTCISVNISELSTMAASATLIAPAIYDSRILSDAPKPLQLFADGLNSSAPQCIVSSLHQNLTWFSKSSEWNNDLWSECVATHYKSSLFVESWIHGYELGPYCSDEYDVLNVEKLDISDDAGTPFSSYNDHSKWAIVYDNEYSIVCFGDINRASTQYQRGGGVFCWEDEDLWKFLSNAVLYSQTCSAIL